MFHRVKSVAALPGLMLSVEFAEEVTKLYDINPLKDRLPVFRKLDDQQVYELVEVDVGGCGVVWTDDIDLSSDELWENGIIVETPFDADCS